MLRQRLSVGQDVTDLLVGQPNVNQAGHTRSGMAPPDLVQRLLWIVIRKPSDALYARITAEVDQVSVQTVTSRRGSAPPPQLSPAGIGIANIVTERRNAGREWMIKDH